MVGLLGHPARLIIHDLDKYYVRSGMDSGESGWKRSEVDDSE